MSQRFQPRKKSKNPQSKIHTYCSDPPHGKRLDLRCFVVIPEIPVHDRAAPVPRESVAGGWLAHLVVQSVREGYRSGPLRPRSAREKVESLERPQGRLLLSRQSVQSAAAEIGEKIGAAIARPGSARCDTVRRRRSAGLPSPRASAGRRRRCTTALARTPHCRTPAQGSQAALLLRSPAEPHSAVADVHVPRGSSIRAAAARQAGFLSLHCGRGRLRRAECL